MQIRTSLVGECEYRFLSELLKSRVLSRASRGQRACLGCCHGESIDAIETGAAHRLARTGWLLGPCTRFPPFPKERGIDISARVKITMLLISVCRTFAGIGITEETTDCINMAEKIRARERSRLFLGDGLYKHALRENIWNYRAPKSSVRFGDTRTIWQK
jgi:hypothetical protein